MTTSFLQLSLRHAVMCRVVALLVLAGCVSSLARAQEAGAITVPTRLVNLSVRAKLAPAEILFLGFTLQGPSGSTSSVLVRAAGPSLTAFGVTDAMANPKLVLMNEHGELGQNDQWSVAPVGIASVTTASFTAVGAFPFATGSHDAAIVRTLPASSSSALTFPAYTALISGSQASDSGTVLGEVYDTSSSADFSVGHLVNLSSRGTVAPNSPLIGGLVITGTQPRKYLVRVVGPKLKNFNVPNPISDPRLDVVDVHGTVIASNDNWSDDGQASTAETSNAMTAVGAFPLDVGSRDAAKVVTLSPGAYTIIASGVNGASGAVLLEIYDYADATAH